jgi:hypothetical protein
MPAVIVALALVSSGCEMIGNMPDHWEFTEIPSGDHIGGPIRKWTYYVDGVMKSRIIYEYPNGYVSESKKLDPEWRKKGRAELSKPGFFKRNEPEKVDYFNFSGQPGSSGATSGSVITPKF